MESPEENEFVNWRWGYVIVLAKFTLMILDAGLAKSFGVLIPEMVVRFDTDYATVGFICSLPSTLIHVACPFVTVVLERTNHRLVALAGAIMSGACLVSCTFSPNIAVLGVLLALTGLGLAFVFMPITLLLNSYFPDRFVLMNTVTLYGLTAGATFLPFIVERSQEAYGYFGSFLILGGISCNGIVCAAAIRQPILKKRSQRHHQGQVGELDCTQMEENDQTAAFGMSDEGLGNPTKAMKPNKSVPWYKSCFTGTSFHYRLFLFNIPTFFLSSYCIYAWMLFLVPHAEQLGISQSHAVFLSSIAGIGGIIGRTIFIILIKKNVNVLLTNVITGIMCTITLLLDFVGTGYLVRAGLAFIQGLCFFMEDAVSFAIVKTTVPDQNEFKRASAVMLLLYGLGATTGGYATGFMFDVTQSYTLVFTIIGGIHAVVIVNIIITLVLLRNQTWVVTNNSP